MSSTPDADPVAAGWQVFQSTSVTYSSAVSDDSDPVSWQWLYTLDGGPEILVNSADSLPVQDVTFAYGSAPGNYIWILRVDDTEFTPEVTFAVEVVAPVPPCGNGVLDVGEQCDPSISGSVCCTVSCTYQPPTATCRVASDSCDVAEMELVVE